MDNILWIVQGVLAALFFMSGMMKLTQSKSFVVEKAGGWADDYSGTQIKLIGLFETLGALGLVLPMLLNMMPKMTLVAAGGLSLIMIFAALTHSKRIENSNVLINIVLLAAGVFIVIGRLIFSPI